MQIVVLQSTENPERLVCQGARGDYFDGYIGDTEYSELMEGVQYSDRDMERVKELRSDDFPRSEQYWIDEARTYSLIRKLVKRGHWGPWEAPQISFAVEGVSRVLMAQVTRHRHLSFDVQSMRYVNFSEKEPVVPLTLRESSVLSRGERPVEIDADTQSHFGQLYQDHFDRSVELYNDMIDAGIPKEEARYVLPTGTPVNMTMSGNARTMFHVLVLRDKPDVQPETREFAQELSNHLHDWIPYSAEVFSQTTYRPSP